MSRSVGDLLRAIERNSDVTSVVGRFCVFATICIPWTHLQLNALLYRPGMELSKATGRV
jgi:hypothetical protein